jgi:uncharacterized protein (DUF1697 family)
LLILFISAIRAGFNKNIKTILATGNVLFEAPDKSIKELNNTISSTLEKNFEFSIPVILHPFSDIEELVERDPFKEIEVTPELRRYVTFSGNEPESQLAIPYTSPDGSFKILLVSDK